LKIFQKIIGPFFVLRALHGPRSRTSRVARERPAAADAASCAGRAGRACARVAWASPRGARSGFGLENYNREIFQKIVCNLISILWWQTRHVSRSTVRRVYRLRLQRTRDGDDIRSLRWVLKLLLRRFGWRVLSIEQER
jgi:hypothetical protein